MASQPPKYAQEHNHRQCTKTDMSGNRVNQAVWALLVITPVINTNGAFRIGDMMAGVKSIRASVAIMALTVSVYAQLTQPGASKWSPKSKQAAEVAVAKKIDEIRASAKLPALKRVTPSTMDVQLVCTAALTGAEVHDPLYAGLRTYVTNDLSAETEALNKVILGLPDKYYPRYSVIVVQNANSTPENPSYTVGVARRPTAVIEFFGPLLGDNPFKDMNVWKKQVAPECRSPKD